MTDWQAVEGQAIDALESVDQLMTWRRQVSPLIAGLSRHILDYVIPRVVECAKDNLPVLIIGPTGTGKEKVTEAIGACRNKKVHSVNCAAIPETLFESLMFGARKGVATGVTDTQGHLREADGKILFLDELGDTPAFVQAKLLRALEERKATALGEKNPYRVDVMLIAATNKPEGLRKDIRWRFPQMITLAPLRERPSDLFDILQDFLEYRKKEKGELPADCEWAIGLDTFYRLVSYPLDGNVREVLSAANTSLVRHRVKQAQDPSLPPNRIRLHYDPFPYPWPRRIWELDAAAFVRRLLTLAQARRVLDVAYGPSQPLPRSHGLGELEIQDFTHRPGVKQDPFGAYLTCTQCLELIAATSSLAPDARPSSGRDLLRRVQDWDGPFPSEWRPRLPEASACPEVPLTFRNMSEGEVLKAYYEYLRATCRNMKEVQKSAKVGKSAAYERFKNHNIPPFRT